MVRTGFGHLASVGCDQGQRGVSVKPYPTAVLAETTPPQSRAGGVQVVYGLQRALLVPIDQQAGTAGFRYLLRVGSQDE
jgi:hypothetical protein